MRKLLIILLCFALLLTGCAKKKQDANNQEDKPTEQVAEDPTVDQNLSEPPADTTPALSATVLADGTRFVLQLAQRDSAVQIVGDYDTDYYIVKTDAGYGVIEKRLVRLENEQVYASWTGYADTDAKFYNNYQLLPEKVWILNWGTKVQVLADLGDRLVVEYGEKTGYMHKSQVRTSYYGDTTADAEGTQISSVTPLERVEPIAQQGEVTGTGTVLVDNAEIVLGWFIREDTVELLAEKDVTEEKEGWYGASWNGLPGYVRKNLVAMDGQERYPQWDGYTALNAGVYDNYYLTGEPETQLYLNAQVRVLADLGNCYLVFDGEDLSFMRKDQISRSWILGDLEVNTLPEIDYAPEINEDPPEEDDPTEGDGTEGDGTEGEGGESGGTEGEGGEGTGGEGEGGEGTGGEGEGGGGTGGEGTGGEGTGGEGTGGEGTGGEGTGGEGTGGEGTGGEGTGGEGTGGGTEGGGDGGSTGGGDGGSTGGGDGGSTGGGDSGGSGGETPPAE